MKKTRLVQMLDRAIDDAGGTQARFADKHGLSQQTVNTWINGRVPTRQFHRKIASILGISDDMMDELIEEAESHRMTSPAMKAFWQRKRSAYQARKDFPPPTLEEDMATNGTFAGPAPGLSMEAPIPVYGQAVGGDMGEYEFNGQVLDWVARPPSLAGVANAYAVFVDGESMVPAYKPGQTVWVHPTRPPRRGDDVVVQVHGRSEHDMPHGYIKEFVGWKGDRLVLQQHNPSREIEFGRADVKTVHTIVFSERA